MEIIRLPHKDALPFSLSFLTLFLPFLLAVILLSRTQMKGE